MVRGCGEGVSHLSPLWPILAQGWCDSFPSMSQRAGGELLVRPSGEPNGDPGSDILWGLVVCIFLLGVLTGLFLAKLWGVGIGIASRISGLWNRPGPWERLTRRVLTFIRKRRLIGLAFHSFQGYALRNQPGSRPNQLRRRRLGSPAPKASPSGLRPLEAMDPTAEELNAMDSLDAVGAWAGTTGPLQTALLRALGSPTKLRDIAFIGREGWDNAVKAITLPDTSVDPAVDRNLNLTEQSRVEIYRRVVLLRLGITPDHPGSLGIPIARVAPTPSGVGSSGSTAPPAVTSPTRKLKLSSILDPTLEAEVIMIEQAEADKLYKEYKEKFGDHPSPDVDPSLDQLSALKQVLATNALPYVDMSIWGPHGLRRLRRQVFTAMVLNPDGEWIKKEMAGPPDLQSWQKAYKTFRAAMLLLQAADAERLDSYADHIRELAQQFGPAAWSIVYTADCRMRSEYMERVRRQLVESPRWGFTPASPWSAVFAGAVREHEYWLREVTTPSTLLLARNKALPQQESSEDEPGAATAKKAKSKKRKISAGDDKSQWDSGLKAYVLNRKGIQICQKFSKGTCGNGKPQSLCPAKRSHQCNLCLGPHMGKDCTGKKKAWPKTQAGTDRKGQGKRKPDGSLPPPEPSEPPKKRSRSRSPLPRKTPGLAAKSAVKSAAKPHTKGSPSNKPSTASSSALPAVKDWYKHGYGCCNLPEAPSQWGDRPRALLIFSGKPRPGDLASYLDRDGWVVVAVDKLAKIPCNILSDEVQATIKADLGAGMYDCLGVATPCETFSPLRESPPGPRPLRSLDKPMGLGPEELTEAENKQLSEANRMLRFSAEAILKCVEACKGAWWENPDHGQKLDMWKTSLAKAVTEKATVFTVGFDQCKFGAETTKPTKFATFLVDLLDVDGIRCDHEKKEYRNSEGKPYKSAHQSLVQRWRDTGTGRERASKALGEYPAALNEKLASGMAKIGTVRTKKLRLATEQIPWHPFHIPFFQDGATTERDRQNELAIGGMRNPKVSASKVPNSLNWGKCLYQAIAKFCQYRQARDLVRNLLNGSPAEPIDEELVDQLRSQLLAQLGYSEGGLPAKTAKASSPLYPPLFAAWGQATGDPDAQTLASWIQVGAILGYSTPIPSNGGKGFCTIYNSMTEARRDLGTTPILSKLGVIVKNKESVRKARIIWDLREWKANDLCNQGERIILPRVLDAVSDALDIFRKGGHPSFLAVDVRDAFHNIPAGEDRSFTTAAFRDEDGVDKVLCYDVLVFGAVSSPTLWGRYAAFLGRSLGAITPMLGLQIYVDDPILAFDSQDPLHSQHLGVALLWFAALGFPIKLSKADAGTKVKWIGASIESDPSNSTVVVSIPSEKTQELIRVCSQFISKPVIGYKQLRSLAGSLSFVAGIVPQMKPFLAGLWAVLASTNDGGKSTRKLIHTKRIVRALEWIVAVLQNFATRTVRALRPNPEVVIITDASTHGMGGVLLHKGEPVEFFSCPIPSVFTKRFGALTGESKHMALWESLCLLIAARTWLSRFPLGAVIRVKADNISALYMISRGKAKSPDLAVVAREMAFDQAIGLYEFTLLQHINTKSNVIADALSRLHDPAPAEFPESLKHGCDRVRIEVTEGFWKVTRYDSVQ